MQGDLKMLKNNSNRRNVIFASLCIALLVLVSVLVYFIFSEKVEYILRDNKVLSGKILFMITILIWGPLVWICIKVMEFFLGDDDG